MAATVARRGVLQGSALTGGLALVGLQPTQAKATPPASQRLPLTGLLGQHIRLDLARGATIRMAQLDPMLQPVREFDEVRMTLAELYDEGCPTVTGTPIQRTCDRAQALARNIVAADWGVPPATCTINLRGIVHAASSQMIAYRTWVDII